LLTIQDGSDHYLAYFRLLWWNHEHKDLAADTDIEYRISGNTLFVKTPTGKEIKASLCKLVGKQVGELQGIQCGNEIIFSKPSPARPGP
jgi:hypothetical protein